jgi:hypothetical protein
MKRRDRVRSARRKLATTTNNAITDLERDFKKAVRILAFLMAGVFMAKQTGGLEIPLDVTVNLNGAQQNMSTDHEDDPAVLNADLLDPSTIRLTEKLKAAVAAEAKRLRVKDAEAHRRILERGLCNPTPASPSLHVPDPSVQVALETLRTQMAALQDEQKLACELIRELRRDLAGQNQVLRFLAEALLDILRMLDPESAPPNPEKTRVFLEKHLRLREREE